MGVDSPRIYDVIQGTPEWLELRRGMLTASTIGRLITPKTIKPASNMDSRALTALLASERITGRVEDTYRSTDMLIGHMVEPIVRDLYSKHYAPVTQCGFMVREIGGAPVGYSPDGLVGEDGLIETKSHEPKKHLTTILADEVPSEHMAQCQTALFVSGRAWLDYISFCGGMALWPKRVEPDPDWFAAILAAASYFEIAVTEMVTAYTTATEGLPATERIEYFPDMEI